MKRPPGISAGVVFTLGLIFILHAQETASPVQTATVTPDATAVAAMSDLQVMMEAIEMTMPMPADSAPFTGNFYTTQHNPESAEPWPPLPGNMNGLPVWDLGGGMYLLDDRNYVWGHHRKRRLTTGGIMQAMDVPSLPDDGDDDDTNFYLSSYTPFVPTTNDLWLEITGTTISGTNVTANIVIHPPSGVTNGDYGLYFESNLVAPFHPYDWPYNWTWLMTNSPGQTNLVVTNLPLDIGFFKLGDPTAIRPGFTNNSLGPNDDDYYGVSGYGDSSDLISNLQANIGFSINFFGTTYTNLYINNNGNVTFNTNLSTWTPYALNSLGRDIIAPFWADVDTRGDGSGVTTYGTNIIAGHRAFGVSWIKVGYFDYGTDRLNSFQLVIIDRSDLGSGDFDLELNYDQIQWEAGDSGGGEDGLWSGDGVNFGSSARAGFANAGGSSTFELNGSGVNNTLLDSVSSGLIYTNLNNTVPGRYVFLFTNGFPNVTP